MATSCFGKVRHPTITAAHQRKWYMVKTLRRPFHYYRCEFCQGWHIASGAKR